MLITQIISVKKLVFINLAIAEYEKFIFMWLTLSEQPPDC